MSGHRDRPSVTIITSLLVVALVASSCLARTAPPDSARLASSAVVQPDSPTGVGRAIEPPQANDCTSPDSSQENDDPHRLEVAIAETPPGRDLYSLVARLKRQEHVAPPRDETAQVLVDGHRKTFWAMERSSNGYSMIDATLKHVTPHAYFYVQDGEEVSPERLEDAGDLLESSILPDLDRFLGVYWLPGVDGDSRITILHARMSGPPGWYYSQDEYPGAISPFSNARRMIYINLSGASPGSRSYYATLAHELQHLMHWSADPSEDTWMNEGLSVLAERLAGFGEPSVAGSFRASPDTQLNAWTEDSMASLAHYGAAYLFASYLAEHFGGYDSLKYLVAQKAHGIQGVNCSLRRMGYAAKFDDVFRDWVVANYLDDEAFDGGRYGYRDLDIRAKTESVDHYPVTSSAVVHQYAADYLELRPPTADLQIVFTGTNTVKLLANDPHSGRAQWWSNRGDVMNTSLTGEFDLSGLTQATLEFWTWFDVEKDFDYAYVEASSDAGATWTTLPAQYTTDTNPNGSNLGHAFTGKSGGSEADWVHERVDLSQFVGQRVLIRFEYVTDDAYNGPGFAIDDISIPELGYSDDAESDGGWQPHGFIRSTNVVPERFALQLIKVGPKSEVESLPLDEWQTGRWIIRGFGRDFEKAVLVVAATAPATTEPAGYQYSFEPLH